MALSHMNWPATTGRPSPTRRDVEQVWRLECTVNGVRNMGVLWDGLGATTGEERPNAFGMGPAVAPGVFAPVSGEGVMPVPPCRCGRRSPLAAACIRGGGPGSSGPAALLVRYFCGELAFLAGTVMSGAVTWNTSSANFRWLASSCSAKL